jgi:hypothetical protein
MLNIGATTLRITTFRNNVTEHNNFKNAKQQPKFVSGGIRPMRERAATGAGTSRPRLRPLRRPAFKGHYDHEGL